MFRRTRHRAARGALPLLVAATIAAMPGTSRALSTPFVGPGSRVHLLDSKLVLATAEPESAPHLEVDPANRTRPAPMLPAAPVHPARQIAGGFGALLGCDVLVAGSVYLLLRSPHGFDSGEITTAVLLLAAYPLYAPAFTAWGVASGSSDGGNWWGAYLGAFGTEAVILTSAAVIRGHDARAIDLAVGIVAFHVIAPIAATWAWNQGRPAPPPAARLDARPETVPVAAARPATAVTAWQAIF